MPAPPEKPGTPKRNQEPSSGPDTMVLLLSGRVTPARMEFLCHFLDTWPCSTEGTVVLCDLGEDVMPDAVTVDALARLQLTAGRAGLRVKLRYASRELQELLTLMGLQDVLPPHEGSALEPRGEPEEGK